ncbi:hypothetical protein [Synechococcus sp. CS-1328]|uniref:hypothetical protein n=1 Tax=Synechococcus sp. CS-1328 TaxID=2847976 RepID=UPI00223BF174|nr:hypothetical protein [Synechococcus sp. CS-1328]MCT0223763.1 hypothetical protein [Synechococcus sp. CS-1328]
MLLAPLFGLPLPRLGACPAFDGVLVAKAVQMEALLDEALVATAGGRPERLDRERTCGLMTMLRFAVHPTPPLRPPGSCRYGVGDGPGVPGGTHEGLRMARISRS